MVMLLMKVYVGAFITLIYGVMLSIWKLDGGVFDGFLDVDEYDDENDEKLDGVAYGGVRG